MEPPEPKRKKGRPLKPFEELSAPRQVIAAKRIWNSVKDAPTLVHRLHVEYEKKYEDNTDSKIMLIITSINRLSVILSQFTRAAIAIIQVRTAEIHVTVANLADQLDVSRATLWRAAVWLKASITCNVFSNDQLCSTDVDDPSDTETVAATLEDAATEDQTDLEGSFPVIRVETQGYFQKKIKWKWHVLTSDSIDKGSKARIERLRKFKKKHGRNALLTLDEFKNKYQSRSGPITVLNFLVDRSAVASGSRNWRKLRTATFQASRPFYVRYCNEKGVQPLKRTQFYYYLHKFGVHPTVWTRYTCPYCVDYLQWETSCKPTEENPEPSPPPLLAKHKELVNIQYAGYDTLLSRIATEPNSALIVADYSKIHELGTKDVNVNDVIYGPTGSLSSIARPPVIEKRKLNLLVWELVTNEPGEDPQVHHFDFFSFSRQVPSFFNAVAVHMQNEIVSRRLKKVYLWTDGGMHNYSNMAVWGRVCNDTGVEIVYLCSAPHHGHGRADAHIGVGKVKLRRTYNGSNGPLLDSAKEVVEVFSDLEDTTAQILDTSLPPVQESWPNWKPGIRSWYAIRISKHPTVEYHVVLECWENAKQLFAEVQPRIITLDISSFYHRNKAIDDIPISDIVDDIPESVQNEVPKMKKRGRPPGSTSKTPPAPLKYAEFDIEDTQKVFQGIPREEIEESTRQAIITSFTMSSIQTTANHLLCNKTMVDIVKKVCGDRYKTLHERRIMVADVLAHLTLKDIAI